MEGILRVDLAGLAEKKSRCRQILDQIRNQKSALAECQCRLEAMWEGDASEALNSGLKEDIGTLEAFCDSLEKLCVFQEKAGNDYAGAENSVHSEIMRIQG